MKKYYYLIINILLLSACSKKTEVTPVLKPVTTKDAGVILFKAAPISDHQVTVSFIDTGINANLAKVILRQDNNVLATLPLSVDANHALSATVDYAFKPGVKYNFVVQSTVVVSSNTINQYSIPEYVHSYVSAYNYQKVLSLSQSLGPNGFDISPSRNYLFILDDVGNTMHLKRVSLSTLNVQDLPYQSAGLNLRAVSDNEILAYGDKSTENLPATADAGSDAVILAKYNIDTRKSTFIDYVSGDYGRISRIVNNHVLITNPVYTAGTASLVNLADLSEVKYPLNDFAFELINSYSFEHILYNNMIVNTNTGKLTQPLALNANSGLDDIDDATGYGFVQSYIAGPQYYTGSFSVYKDKTAVYQSDQVLGRTVSFPIIYNLQNNVLTYYASYGYDTKVNIDGYYTLNIKTGEIKLIQADSNIYVISDYQLSNGSVFSVRADGVYKLTPR